MNQLGLPLLFLLFFHVTAQQQMNDSSPSADAVESFQPSLAVVIGILCLMFSLTFILLLYAKFCQRRASAHVDPENNHPELARSRSRRFSGIDKTVIESLPFFRFSSLKGFKEGLECAVCLSKFEDVEILRLLPKCKHAFHIDCIDHWLERHSSCPLCRRKVSSDDPTMLTYSNSLRLLTNQSENNGEDPNIEIFVQREEDQRYGPSSSSFSSRFRIGSSFRKSGKGIAIKEEELPIQEEESEHDDGDGKLFHKHNHKITVSDVVFKHRWSNVSSSDLMFLNSEMIMNSAHSKRFDFSEPNGEKIQASTSGENGHIINIKEEMERKISFETKVGALNSVLDSSECVGTSSSSHTSKHVNPGDKRSMSEITGVARFGDLGMRDRVLLRDSSMISSDVKEERRRQLWLPIARRTVQWLANRERTQPFNV